MNLVSLNNSVFTNNYVYAKNGDDIDYNAYLFYGVTDSIISDCIFENNVASAISGSNVNLTKSTFKNNSRVINSRNTANAVVALNGDNNTVTLCKFIDNSLNLNNSQSYSGEPSGALSIQNAVVSNSLFEGNGIDCSSVWLTVNGAAIRGSNLIITDNNFTANYINTVKGTSASTESYEFDFKSSGYGVDISADGTTTIKNNQFTNSTGNQDVGSIYSGNENSQIEITNNTFTNCKANKETIAVITEDKTITDNTYNNCTIGFKSFNLTAPSKIYSNEDVTVTLDIELANPTNYDSDLLEKTDYNWYINGTNTTDKDTSKTISIGTDTIIVYVTPTVSNNRSRVLALTPTILNDIIITPDNINSYIFEGEVIASPNSRLIFNGTFQNLGEIYNNKNQIIFDGTNANFTNTAFKIEANDNTIQNMNIENTDTSEYIITIIGNNNTIQNNTLTQTNNNGKTATIYILNSNNTLTQNNKLTSTGPSIAIQYGESSTIANTQAILQEAGENNTITQNTITVSNSTDAELDAFSTIEAITAPKGTNTQTTSPVPVQDSTTE